MWWLIGIGGLFLYLLVPLHTRHLHIAQRDMAGCSSLGCFFPVFWVIGASMSPVDQEYAQAP